EALFRRVGDQAAVDDERGAAVVPDVCAQDVHAEARPTGFEPVTFGSVDPVRSSLGFFWGSSSPSEARDYSFDVRARSVGRVAPSLPRAGLSLDLADRRPADDYSGQGRRRAALATRRTRTR